MIFRNCHLYLIASKGETVTINNTPCSTTNIDPELILTDSGDLIIQKNSKVIWSFRVLSPISDEAVLSMKPNSRQCLLRNVQMSEQNWSEEHPNQLPGLFNLIIFQSTENTFNTLSLNHFFDCRIEEDLEEDICTMLRPATCLPYTHVWECQIIITWKIKASQ